MRSQKREEESKQGKVRSDKEKREERRAKSEERRKKRKETPKEAAKGPQMMPPEGGQPFSRPSRPLGGLLASLTLSC